MLGCNLIDNDQLVAYQEKKNSHQDLKEVQISSRNIAALDLSTRDITFNSALLLEDAEKARPQ